MKLDKLTFAKLVAHCVSNGMSAGEWEVNQLDMICDVNLPEPAVIQPSAEDIDKLMFLLMQGTQKIEAIKVHRKLTGFGLKESKDAVEKYWSTEIKRTKQEIYNALNAENFSPDVDDKIAKFINKVY